MLDSYGRNIDYLRLSVTDACNYKCIYCMNSEGISRHNHCNVLSIEELINISKIAVDCGIRKIRITGGEPLLYEGIINLCVGLKSINGLEELSLTTNGSKLFTMSKALKNAGVDRLNISLDTLNEEKFKTITRNGNLKEVLQGLDAAVSHGFTNIKINVVLMKGINDDEIASFCNLTKKYPIQVRFIELMPIGPCKEGYKDKFVSTNAVLEALPELKAENKDGVARMYKLDNALGSVGLISPITNYFCEECNRLRVTSEGQLLPCLHSDLKYDLRGFSNQEIRNTICTAMKNKPKRHNISINNNSDNKSFMNQIGG